MIPLIDWFVLLSEVALLVGFNLRFGEVLGGSMVFFILIICLFYFSYFHKLFQEELSRLSLAALSLVGLNVLAYLEHSGAVPRLPILAGYLGISVVFTLAIYQVQISPIRSPREGPREPDPVKVQLIRNIALVFLSIPLQVLLMFVLPSGIAVWIGQKSRLVETNWVSVTTLAILCQVVGTLVHRPFLRRVTDPQIVYVLKRRVAIPNLKQKVVLSLLVLFVLGSLGELGRGLWFFWAGSFAFWTLTLANTWKVWKHVFAPPSAAVGEEAITPAYDVLKDFKFFLYSIIIGRVYAIGLIVLLALTTSKRF